MSLLRSILFTSASLGLLPACGLMIGLDEYGIDKNAVIDPDSESGGRGAIGDDGSSGGDDDGGSENGGSGSASSGGAPDGVGGRGKVTSGGADMGTGGEGGDGAGGQSKGAGGDSGGGGGGGNGGDSGGGNGTGGVGEGPACVNGADCNDNIECTLDQCNSGFCANSIQVGQACNGGVCDGAAECVICANNQGGLEQDAGCSAGAPLCDVSANAGYGVCVQCIASGDCNDGLECTTDECNGNQCDHWSWLVGSSCTGDQSYCNGAGTTPICEVCADNNSPFSPYPDAGCPSDKRHCDTSGATTCVACITNTDCSDGNECTTDICNSESVCTSVPVPRETLCSGGVCDGDPLASQCDRCLDNKTGTDQDIGCGAGAPQCDITGAPICVGCQDNADCDDGNECTVATCDVDQKCSIAPLALGTICGVGVCTGIQGAEACLPCVNDQSDGSTDAGCDSAAPHCDTTGAEANDNVCVTCIDDVTGSETDTGCDASAPYCSAGSCVTCLSELDCDDGVSCTNDICDAGSCQNTADDGNCSGGTVCQPMYCDPVDDCKLGDDLTSTVALIDETPENGNGSFEALDDGGLLILSPWVERADYVVYYCMDGDTCPVIDGLPASDGDLAAWLGSVNDADFGISQPIAIPPGTVRLTLLADLAMVTEELVDDGAWDFLTVNINDTGGELLFRITTFSNDDAEQLGSMAWDLDGINQTFNAAAWAGGTVALSFDSITDLTRVTDFLVDNVRLTATVCQ